MADLLTGGCLCEAVRYTVRQTMRFQSYVCHCTDCQTRSGSAFGIQLSVLTGDLEVSGALLKGEHVQPSGAVAGIYACEKCLTRIYTDNDRRPGIANLRAGTLDNSQALAPATHLWVSSKLPWVVIPEEAVAMDRQPEDMVGWLKVFKPESA